VLDDAKAPAVEAIYRWRTEEKAGLSEIGRRLTADPQAYPPPPGGLWSVFVIWTILRNPKYTGYMVWNRTTSKGTQPGKKRVTRPNPPSEWVWSPEPTHPAIVSRDAWELAQQITADRASERSQALGPAGNRAYELRSRVRHATCHRRMHGITRPAGTYYTCPYDTKDPRRATMPDHPTTVLLREDLLLPVVAEFIQDRILGPERGPLLDVQFPASTEGQAAQAAQRARRLATELRRLAKAQDDLITNIAAIDPAAPAATEIRHRLHTRFADLQADHAQTTAALAALTAPHDDRTADTALLAALPVLTARLDQLPPGIRAKIYQAIDLQVLYRHDMTQVTIRAAITTHTPPKPSPPSSTTAS
jgi:site-specific DNA recombinase